MGRIGTIWNCFGSCYPKRPNMGQIGPQEIGADLAFGADWALSILQCSSLCFDGLWRSDLITPVRRFHMEKAHLAEAGNPDSTLVGAIKKKTEMVWIDLLPYQGISFFLLLEHLDASRAGRKSTFRLRKKSTWTIKMEPRLPILRVRYTPRNLLSWRMMPETISTHIIFLASWASRRVQRWAKIDFSSAQKLIWKLSKWSHVYPMSCNSVFCCYFFSCRSSFNVSRRERRQRHRNLYHNFAISQIFSVGQ